jgi:hypothetical protein
MPDHWWIPHLDECGLSMREKQVIGARSRQISDQANASLIHPSYAPPPRLPPRWRNSSSARKRAADPTSADDANGE